MNDESIYKLKKFIENKINEGATDINVHWFGGEPLLKQNKIIELEQYFINELLIKYTNIKFSNGITTNGYLLNKEFVSDIINKTNIHNIQVTLDGLEKIHFIIKT